MSNKENDRALAWLFGYIFIVGAGLTISNDLHIHPAVFLLFLAGVLLVRHARASLMDERLAQLQDKIEQLTSQNSNDGPGQLD